MGSYLQQSVHRGSLEPTGSKTAYQCIGIEGCPPGPAVIPQPDTSSLSLCISSTAVAYLSKRGGTHSTTLFDQALQIREYVLNKGYWIMARHIPGVLSVEADLASREFNPHTKWMLDKTIFKKITVCFFVLVIDLFASHLNHQVPLHMSRDPDPGSMAADAFRQSWGRWKSFIHLPIVFLSRIIQKVRQDRATTLLVAPNWPGQLVSGIVSDADRSPTAATNQGVAANPAIPTWDDSPTVAFSAPDSMANIRKCYRAGLSSEVIKILLSSWSPATQKRYSALWNTWAQWCTNHRLCPISAPVTDVLSFLANLTTQGLEYRTIAVYKSAISQVHNPVGQTTLGNLPIVSRFMKGIFRSTPPKPCLCSVWKVADALNWVSTLEPIGSFQKRSIPPPRMKLKIPSPCPDILQRFNLPSLSLDIWVLNNPPPLGHLCILGLRIQGTK